MRHVETAPAKLNLALSVRGKRPDGFHEIETLMVPIADLADELRFDLETGEGEVELTCDDPGLPTGSDNLVLLAVERFCDAAGRRVCGSIELTKRIPSGAGLGGGSSDAAATLRALNRLTGAALSDGALCEIAAGIGSDIPFFIKGEPAWCRGRGEILEDYREAIPATRVLLAKPGFGVPSAWAYQRWAESEFLPGVDYAGQRAPWGDAVNDLERPVFEKYLVLAVLKGWLQARDETGLAMMSGSGATVFATLKDPDDFDALRADLRAEFGPDLWLAPATIGTVSDPAAQ